MKTLSQIREQTLTEAKYVVHGPDSKQVGKPHNELNRAQSAANSAETKSGRVHLVHKVEPHPDGGHHVTASWEISPSNMHAKGYHWLKWAHKDNHPWKIQVNEGSDAPPPKTEIVTPDVDNLLATRSKDIKKFIQLHKIKKTGDANGNGDDVFKGASVKTFDRAAHNYGRKEGEDAALYEALRLIKTHVEGPHTAKVYKDPEWEEHRVKFYTHGVHNEKADYHTTDVDDAHGTAKLELKRMKGLNEGFEDIGQNNRHPLALEERNKIKGVTKTDFYPTHDGENVAHFHGSMKDLHTHIINSGYHADDDSLAATKGNHIWPAQPRKPGEYDREEDSAGHMQDREYFKHENGFSHNLRTKNIGPNVHELTMSHHQLSEGLMEALKISKSSGLKSRSAVQIKKFQATTKDGVTKAVYAGDEKQAAQIAGKGAKLSVVREEDDNVVKVFNSLTEDNKELFLVMLEDEAATEKLIAFSNKIFEGVTA